MISGLFPPHTVNYIIFLFLPGCHKLQRPGLYRTGAFYNYIITYGLRYKGNSPTAPLKYLKKVK